MTIKTSVRFGRDWTSFSDRSRAAQPAIDCRALVSLTNYQVTIETAALVAATADVPEHCRVTGQILPEIRFEVTLPTSWQRRLYMFGNGGYAGEALTASARVVEDGRSPAELIASQAAGSPPRTRPLGPYPEVAGYKRTGSISEAANFVCRSPEH